MAEVIDITGQRFGKLVVTGRAPKEPGAIGARWHVRCDCGKDTIALSQNLRYGLTKSCGCGRGRPGGTGQIWVDKSVKNPNTTRDWLTPWKAKNAWLFDGKEK